MQSDKRNKIFSILKNTSDSLILKSDNDKFYRKTFQIQQQQLKTLVERQKLTHPNLITLNQLQFSHFIDDQKIAIDVIFEHYSRTLNQCMVSQHSTWEDAEIINTFQPIVDAVDYLVKQNFILEEFSFKNIVITENHQVKYIDSFLNQKEITQLKITPQTNNFNQHKIYAQIAQTIFLILYPKFPSKIWKNRLKIVKQQKSSPLYEFIASLINKSTPKNSDNLKKKKIKKGQKNIKLESIKQIICKTHKEQRNQKIQKDKLSLLDYNSGIKHQGKQNKLLQ